MVSPVPRLKGVSTVWLMVQGLAFLEYDPCLFLLVLSDRCCCCSHEGMWLFESPICRLCSGRKNTTYMRPVCLYLCPRAWTQGCEHTRQESAAHPHLQLLLFFLIQGPTKLPRLTLSNSCRLPRQPLNLWLSRLRFTSSWDFRPVPSCPTSLLPLTTVSLCFICMEISVFCMSSS